MCTAQSGTSRSVLFFWSSGARRDLHSFPTRRSSDLLFGLGLHADPGAIRHLRIALQEPLEDRSEEHTSELQSHSDLVCRLLLEKKQIRLSNSWASWEGTPRSIVPMGTRCARAEYRRP